MGRTEFSTRNDYDASLGLERHFFSESEMALFFECTPKCAPKLLDTADIVRDACYQQPSLKSTAHDTRFYAQQ
jgi:hypothetical protein